MSKFPTIIALCLVILAQFSQPTKADEFTPADNGTPGRLEGGGGR